MTVESAGLRGYLAWKRSAGSMVPFVGCGRGRDCPQCLADPAGRQSCRVNDGHVRRSREFWRIMDGPSTFWRWKNQRSTFPLASESPRLGLGVFRAASSSRLTFIGTVAIAVIGSLYIGHLVLLPPAADDSVRWGYFDKRWILALYGLGVVLVYFPPAMKRLVDTFHERAAGVLGYWSLAEHRNCVGGASLP